MRPNLETRLFIFALWLTACANHPDTELTPKLSGVTTQDAVAEEDVQASSGEPDAVVDGSSGLDARGPELDADVAAADARSWFDASTDAARDAASADANIEKDASTAALCAQLPPCDAPDQICRVIGGTATCVYNVAYDVGNKDASLANLWQPFSPDPQKVYMLPFTSTRDAYVAALRLSASASGGACRMSLYDDQANFPSQKLFSIGENIALSATHSTGAVPPIAVFASANKTYWLAAACGASTTGIPAVLQRARTGELYYELSISSFSAFMPVQLHPTALSPVRDVALSFFVSLLDVP